MDSLDAQVFANIKEIEEIRIPEATLGVTRDKFKKNNMFYFTALISASGQFFREIAANWDLQSIDYQAILNTASRQFAGAAYAGTRLMLLVDPRINCGLETFKAVKKSARFQPLFQLPSYYGFLNKRRLVKLPFQYLNIEVIPKVLQVKAALLGIELKDKLACLMEPKVEESSDLIRAIDNLVSAMDKRLQVSDNLVRLLTKRAEISEPVHFVWYPD